MGFRLQELLFTPDRFFREQGKEPIHLIPPALLVGILGITSAGSAILVTQLTIQILPADAQQFAGIVLAIAAVGGFITSFLMWLVASIIFFAFSAAFKRTGTLKRTMEFTGYGFLPMIFGALVNLYFMYDVVSSVKIPQVSDPMLLQEALQGLMSHPSFQLASVVGVLFLLWSANLWIFGLKYAREITTRNAAIAVLVPVGIYILYTLFNLLTLFGGA